MNNMKYLHHSTQVNEKIIMDNIDKKILNALQVDGRITNQNLAEKVGISSAACWRRTKAMEKNGTIKKYMAIVNAKTVGHGLCIFVNISLTRHSKEMPKNLPRPPTCALRCKNAMP